MFGTPNERDPWIAIAGVAADMHRRRLHQGARLEVFLSTTQNIPGICNCWSRPTTICWRCGRSEDAAARRFPVRALALKPYRPVAPRPTRGKLHLRRLPDGAR